MNQKFFDDILKMLADFFSKNDSTSPAAQTSVDPPAPSTPVVDWNNPSCKISKHFSVKEALTLQSWGVMHNPTEDQKQAILSIAAKIDKVADILESKLGRPVSINVHAWIRPAPAICPGTQWDGQDYNKWVYWNEVWKGLTDAEKAQKHVPLSPHRTGHAVDFHVGGFEGAEECAKIREMLLPHLEELGLRMEDIQGGWIHLDDLPVIHSRFFKP